MSYKENLQELRKNILKIVPKKRELPQEKVNTELSTLDEDLDLLLNDNASLLSVSITPTKKVIRLIIVLDISYSMMGTEADIETGLRDLVNKYKNEDILFNFVTFTGERIVIFDDAHISNVVIPELCLGASTNLNGSLYYTINHKCQTGENLLVTISDGEDNVFEVSADKVKNLMDNLNGTSNYFYFLGEPNESQTPEEVYATATELGFKEDNISIFTREGNGNRLNFEVISDMLNELIRTGHISKSWSEPIKEHYLRLTDRRCR